jgi:hypothetical protein
MIRAAMQAAEWKIPSDDELAAMVPPAAAVALADMLYYAAFGRAYADTQADADAWGAVAARAVAHIVAMAAPPTHAAPHTPTHKSKR